MAIGLSLAGGPAFAEGAKNGAGEKSLGAEVDDAVKRALRALDYFIDSIPGYEAPEITPEGDIIIRKKRPKPKGGDAPSPDERRT